MKKSQFIIICLLLLITIPVLIGATTDSTKIDGIKGGILSLFFTTDTKYAPGYSHHNFLKIKPGMTEQQVLDIMGESLNKWKPYKNPNNSNTSYFIVLQYSESPSSTHYRLRQVYLNNGVVSEIKGYFYLD